MPTLATLQELIHRSRRTYAAGLAAVLLTLLATVLVGWVMARVLIRQMILQRDAQLFHATTLMEQLDARQDDGSASFLSDEQIGFDAAILASRLRGVMGIRFYTPEGEFSDTFPASIQPQPLDAESLHAVQLLKPHSRFRPDTPLSEVLIYLPSFTTGRVDRVPIVEVTVPLHRRDGTELAGAAQFIVEGQTVAEEFRALDRHLAGLAGQILLVAGLLLTAMLWLTFRQVERLNRELAQRNQRLVTANEQLAMAARTSALGAVSAHLMHGLKNPLASLTEFVRSHGDAPPETAEHDWEDALQASRRMQALVEETLEVLADTRGQPLYEVGIQELVEGVRSHGNGVAAERGVKIIVEGEADGMLSSRVANLVRLILTNLLENALQATPSGKAVRIGLRQQSDALEFIVQDEGPGFPAQLRSRLFLPCKSTREGGSGIGLSLCRQLADHLGATLELRDPPAGGCAFALILPLNRTS